MIEKLILSFIIGYDSSRSIWCYVFIVAVIIFSLGCWCLCSWVDKRKTLSLVNVGRKADNMLDKRGHTETFESKKRLR